MNEFEEKLLIVMTKIHDILEDVEVDLENIATLMNK